MLKKLTLVFILSFIFNIIWEILHSTLYLNYKGLEITSFILFRAAIFDAIFISLIIFISQKLTINKSFFIVLVGLILAIGIEIWALQTGRWGYSPWMPIIPFIKTGLTPTIQLALTGYIVNKICFRRKLETI